MGHLAGGVPGRARGELRLLDQQAVAPALLGQVIEQADPHDPAADDDDPRLLAHVGSSRPHPPARENFQARAFFLMQL
jgi:hypothetical protein